MSDATADSSSGTVVVVLKVRNAVIGTVVVVEMVSRLAGTVTKAVLTTGFSVLVSEPVA